MREELHWSFRNVCTCGFTRASARGTYEAGTNRWMPDAPTVHVRMIADDSCPIHGEVSSGVEAPGLAARAEWAKGTHQPEEGTMDLSTALDLFRTFESEKETDVEDDPPTYEVRLDAATSRDTGRRSYSVRVIGNRGWGADRDAWQFVMEQAVEHDVELDVDNSAMVLR